ncbi:hypothetical protein KY084_12605 [Stakelama sp. CBK3Z-3]|uniref:DUF6438 domain-containing protein n=1 Tax=Stakelama flava TaxID=2860338 RepID=A0ABS6XQM7_9SPHN|nr:DUF6438 domain-containing protein [Stakelama flava]MBW4331711.1 hypothetical protein [Stakelama flava]
MKSRSSIILAALAVAACARTPQRPTGMAAAAPESITYETGACFGRCPVYSVTVRSDGTGTFDGKRFTQVSGSRDFTLTPTEYAAFAKRLVPYRPNGERLYKPGQAICANYATDMRSVDVRWSGAGGGDHLYVYFGCDRQKNAAMFDAVGGAVDALPLESLIGAQP